MLPRHGHHPGKQVPTRPGPEWLPPSCQQHATPAEERVPPAWPATARCPDPTTGRGTPGPERGIPRPGLGRRAAREPGPEGWSAYIRGSAHTGTLLPAEDRLQCRVRCLGLRRNPRRLIRCSHHSPADRPVPWLQDRPSPAPAGTKEHGPEPRPGRSRQPPTPRSLRRHENGWMRPSWDEAYRPQDPGGQRNPPGEDSLLFRTH